MANTTALGITLPIQRGNNGYFRQAFDIRSQIKSNLTNLILTRKGERLMQPEFGCDIYRIIFQPIDDDNQSEIRASIEQAVQTWMPFVSVEDVQVIRNENYNKIQVSVTYSIISNVQISDIVTLLF